MYLESVFTNYVAASCLFDMNIDLYLYIIRGERRISRTDMKAPGPAHIFSIYFQLLQGFGEEQPTNFEK